MLELIIIVSILLAAWIILNQLWRSPEAALIVFMAQTPGIGKIQVTRMLLRVSQQLPISIGITDKAGNPAPVDGPPAWSLTDPSMGAIAAASDGMSAVFTPAGKLGDVTVQVSADADLGAGVKSIIGELPVSITGGDAAFIALTGGAPADI